MFGRENGTKTETFSARPRPYRPESRPSDRGTRRVTLSSRVRLCVTSGLALVVNSFQLE